MNVHFHSLVLDGVYRCDDAGPVFVEAPPPTDEDVQAVLDNVVRRVLKMLTRRGAQVQELDSICVADADGESDDARAAQVPVVAGDTKVVQRGKGDGVFIATTGVGTMPEGRHLSGALARAGDAVLLSGPIGDHGVAVLSRREGVEFDASIVSDCAALHGLDPLYVANEGKLIAIVGAASADAALAAPRADPLARDAARIGEVIVDPQHFVQMRTALGGRRMVDWLAGEQLSRIC